MNHWLKQCENRMVPMRAVLDKLQACQDEGIDVDRIPLSLSVGELIRLPLSVIKGMAECHR